MNRYVIRMAALLALCAMSLTACMNTAGDGTADATVSPAQTAYASPSAQATDNGAMQTVTAAPGQQGSASTSYDWTKGASEIESRIDQISEISDSRVIVNGDTALVGVRFSSGYKGELTERIREMVAAVIMEADPSVRTVAVTADPDDVKAVGALEQRFTAGTAIEELADEIQKIIRNVTTMR